MKEYLKEYRKNWSTDVFKSVKVDMVINSIKNENDGNDYTPSVNDGNDTLDGLLLGFR